MIWSFSQNRVFRKCPRQWFYRTVFAESRAKDPARRDAYLLSKLQSVSAWRGNLVDFVIKDFVVPAVNRGGAPTLRETLERAKAVFAKQLEFARNHRIREPGVSPAKAAESFAAFYKIEYGEPIREGEFDQAWADVEAAFRKLYAMDEVRQLIRGGAYRVAQRSLTFKQHDASVRAVPDLIVFFHDRAPLVVDWKVHSFGIRGYADQLTTYAIALVRTNPHKDFVKYVNGWNATAIELMEVQLLRGLVRRHAIEEVDVQAADDRIAEGILAMQFACDGKRPSDLRPEDFPTAHKPQSCQTCPFRKPCWRTEP